MRGPWMWCEWHKGEGRTIEELSFREPLYLKHAVAGSSASKLASFESHMEYLSKCLNERHFVGLPCEFGEGCEPAGTLVVPWVLGPGSKLDGYREALGEAVNESDSELDVWDCSE